MKKYRVSLVLIMLSVVLFSISIMLGSSVNEQGMLVESAFFCIPLAYLSLLGAAITSVVIKVRYT